MSENREENDSVPSAHLIGLLIVLFLYISVIAMEVRAVKVVLSVSKNCHSGDWKQKRLSPSRVARVRLETIEQMDTRIHLRELKESMSSMQTKKFNEDIQNSKELEKHFRGTTSKSVLDWKSRVNETEDLLPSLTSLEVGSFD